MQSNSDKTEYALAGVAKSPIPKLTRADRARVKRMLESASEELDPVSALRLALAAKLPIRPEWRTEAAIDMALETGDLARRSSELAEGQLVLKATAILIVMERRSRTSPIPVFRGICTMTLPPKRKEPAKYSIVWDEDTAIRIGRILIEILPAIFKAKAAKSAKDRKSTRLNSSHIQKSRMPSSA